MELFDDQRRSVENVRASLRAGNKRPLLVGPTGSGKTVIASHIIQKTVEKNNHVLFLAPRRQLVYQTAEKLATFGVPFGVQMAGERPSISPQIQVGSIQTMARRFFHKGEMITRPPPANLIVIDEAHAAMGAAVQLILTAYPDIPILGLTATPSRSDGRGLGEIYDDLVLGPSVKELTDAGRLVPVRYFGGSTADLSKIKIVRGDYDEKALGKEMSAPKLLGNVVSTFKQVCHDRLAVVFAVNRAHALSLAQEFEAAGIRAGYIDGETPNDERHKLFADLEAGSIQVLCSVDVVSMGWDCPPVSCGIIARPTKSVARYLQMGGRILRTFPGKEDAILIDHAGAVSELGYLDDDHDWSLDSASKIQEREADGKKKKKEPMVCHKCQHVFDPAPVCPNCGAKLGQVYAKAQEFHEAKLEELERPAKTTFTPPDKAMFYGELKYYANQHGYKSGWASNKYKEVFGVWPNHYKKAPLIKPGPATAGWIKSRQIAYGKRR